MATENVLINFEVNYEELTKAQDELAKTGKVDTKAFEKIQAAIDTTATDTKGLIKTFKDVAGASIKMGKTVEDAFGAGIQDALDEAGVSLDEFQTSLKKANAPAITLKKELQQLKEAMARMKSEGKDTGKEFDALRQRAGKLSDAIADANQEIKNAGSDTRGIDNVVGSISALAGGYAAVQGAAALFGEENEDLQRALLKVNGAMALASGLQQTLNALQKEGALTKLADSVATKAQAAATTLYTFVTAGATVATKALRAALIATGIGAIVVLVLSLVSALDIFGNSTEDAAEAQKKLKEEFEGTNNAIDSLLTNLGNIRNQQLAIAKLEGKSLGEQFKISQGFRETEIKALRKKVQIAYDFFTQQEELYEDEKATLDDISAARSEYAKAQQNLNNAISSSNVEKYNEEFRINEASKKLLDDNTKKREIAAAKLTSERQKAYEDEIAYENQIAKAKKEARDADYADHLKDLHKRAMDRKQFYANALAALKKSQDDEEAEYMEAYEKRIAKDKKDDEDAAAADAAALARKIKNANITIDIANRVASIYSQIAQAQTDRDNQLIASQRKVVEDQLRAGVITQKAATARLARLDQAARDAQNRAARREKQAAMFSAALAIPKAVLQGLSTGGPLLAAIYGALAAVEFALIASRPVPRFFRGKKDKYSGPGMVADMGSELVERDGRMYLYTKPTQTYLGANDKVYTASETRNIMHNTNINTTVRQPKQEGFDYARLAASIPVSTQVVNIDKDFISESVANGLSRINYMDRRYSSRK